MGVPVFLFNQNPVNQIFKHIRKNPDGTFWDGGVKGFVRGIPIWNSVNQILNTSGKNPVRTFLAFIYVSEV